MDGIISTHRFAEWVNEFLDITYEENEDEALWEFFLHKVHDKSFSGFLKECKKPKEAEPVDAETTASTIKESYDMLAGFVPE